MDVPCGGGSLPIEDNEWESLASAIVDRDCMQFDDGGDLMNNSSSNPEPFGANCDVLDALSTLYRAKLIVHPEPDNQPMESDSTDIRVVDEGGKKVISGYCATLLALWKRKTTEQSDVAATSDDHIQKRPQFIGGEPDVGISVLSSRSLQDQGSSNFHLGILKETGISQNAKQEMALRIVCKHAME